MNFTKFDMFLLISMSFSIIVMSFVMPSADLTGTENETEESDVPEFDIDSSRFDIAGEFPDRPGSSSSGTLRFNNSNTNTYSTTGISLAWLDRPKLSGVSVELQNGTDTGLGENLSIVVVDYNDTGVVEYQGVYNITSEDNTYIYNKNEWVIRFDVEYVNNLGQSNMTGKVSYDIKENGGENTGGGLSAIPVVGTLFDAGEVIGSTIAWIGNVFLWTFTFVFEIAINLLSLLLDSMIFGIDLLTWMIDGYAGMTSKATGWASVILLVPSIILFIELLKIVMIAISLMPTT